MEEMYFKLHLSFTKRLRPGEFQRHFGALNRSSEFEVSRQRLVGGPELSQLYQPPCYEVRGRHSCGGVALNVSQAY
ncbi:hypothetical protein NDU88_004465 [Pleurodeles waltl]|uniref:Uncharacterized protein n=1 Tax=Pleurodeles waltl TaxID=8319 RepID=A0AAV7QCP3_PLEWA|nr:hypothetical protein NDU88_004465 [Pleurodeles waltl]